MNTSPKHLLRLSVERLLLPELEKLGFSRIPLSTEDQNAREIASLFPYGRFKRLRDSRIELLEIQFKKGGAPAFRLNIAVVPSEGVMGPRGRIDSGDVWAHYCDDYFVVYERKLFHRWFQIRRPLWSRSLNALQGDSVVRRVLGLLPEIEATLATGKPGPHMDRVQT